MIRFFSPVFSVNKISEVVYLCQNITPSYREALLKIGKDLGIAVHICVGGLSSTKFQKSWTIRINQFRNSQKESTGQSLEHNDDDMYNSDDQDSISNPNRSFREEKKAEDSIFGSTSQSNKHDDCIQFLQHMIKKKEGSTQNKRSLNPDTAETPEKRKRTGRSSLQSRPKVQGSMRNFFALKDRELQNLRVAALKKESILKGGNMQTRFQKRLQQEQQQSQQQQQQHLPLSDSPVLPHKKGRRGRKRLHSKNSGKEARPRKLVDEGVTASTPADGAALPLPVDIEFKPNCLLIFDDLFVPQSFLHQKRWSENDRDNKEISSQVINSEKNSFLNAVALASQISLELAHHMKVNLKRILSFFSFKKNIRK